MLFLEGSESSIIRYILFLIVKLPIELEARNYILIGIFSISRVVNNKNEPNMHSDSDPIRT